MTPLKLSRGDELVIAGKRFRVDSQPDNAIGKEFNLYEVDTNRSKLITSEEILNLFRRGEIVIQQMPKTRWSEGRRALLEQPFDSRPPEIQEETRRRYSYVSAYYKRGPRSRSAHKLRPFISSIAADINDASPPSPRTICNWLRLWEDAGGRNIRALAPATQVRGNRTPRRDPEVLNIVQEALDTFYLRETPLSVAAIREIVAAEIAELNKLRDKADHLEVPSIRFVYRQRAKLNGFEVLARQRGRRAAELEYRPVGTGLQPTAPNEEVEIDHTPLDIIAVDKNLRIPIGRPTLTVAIDRCTRMIVGHSISFGPPSYRSVMQCLRNSILPKNYVADLYPDISGEWPCHGLPQTVFVDNGRDFHSVSLEDGCAALGIDIAYTPVRSPWWKGRVERFFRTLGSVMHAVPGTTFSNITKRADYDPSGKARLDLEEISALFHYWLIEIYSRRLHRGLKDVPVQRWLDGVEKHPVRMPRSLDELDAFLGRVECRRLSKKGIELFGLHYNSYDIAEIRTRRGRDNCLVKVKVDVDNIGSIRIEDPDTKRYIDVPCTDRDEEGRLYGRGMSLFQHEAATAYVKARTKARIDVKALARAHRELYSRLASIAKRQGVTNKRATLVREGPFSTPIGTLPRPADNEAASARPLLSSVSSAASELASTPDLQGAGDIGAFIEIPEDERDGPRRRKTGGAPRSRLRRTKGGARTKHAVDPVFAEEERQMPQAMTEGEASAKLIGQYDDLDAAEEALNVTVETTNR